MVECLNCGLRREHPEHECQRCSYTGWTVVSAQPALTFELRRVEPVVSLRHLRSV